jgi:hypothetical protein
LEVTSFQVDADLVIPRNLHVIPSRSAAEGKRIHDRAQRHDPLTNLWLDNICHVITGLVPVISVRWAGRFTEAG